MKDNQGIPPGTIVAERYEVLQKIGEGGMAVVYRVEQIFLKEIQALKVLNEGLSDVSVARFQKEAQVCRLLEHPNLIKVYDLAILDNGIPYFAMEFLTGETLSQLLTRHGAISEADAIDIFSQVMEGLDYAHSQGVVHRDLKPSNIMLRRKSDKSWEVKILDFGIAKMTGKDTVSAMDLTRTGEIFGSPFYMSPEQCLGRAVDVRSDLYSVGCALYQSLTGLPPFVGETALATLMMHQNSDPAPLREASMGNRFSPTIEKIVFKLLEKLPEARYQRAMAVYDDLVALKKRAPVTMSEEKVTSNRPKGTVSPTVLIISVLILSVMCIGLAGTLVYVLMSPNKTSVPASKLPPEPPVFHTRSKTKSKFFAETSIKDSLTKNWVFQFPEYEIGTIGQVWPTDDIDDSVRHARPAKNEIRFEKAQPVLFATDMYNFSSSEFLRFRPDEIEQLKLSDYKVLDETLTMVENFTSLKALELNDCTSLTDACLTSIARIPNLKYFKWTKNDLEQNSVASIDSVALAEMVANSKITTVNFEHMDHADLLAKHLKNNKTLRQLFIYDGKGLTDKGLADIASISGLDSLRLVRQSQITDKGIAQLVKLQNLKRLSLQGAALTPAYIPIFKKLPKGCLIAVSGNTCKQQFLDEFIKEFPGCRVP